MKCYLNQVLSAMMKLIGVFSLIAFFQYSGNGQCVASGTMSPTSEATYKGVGSVSWSGIENIVWSNNSRATASAFILGDKTHYLVADDFGLNIPNGVNICGIEVKIEKSATGILQAVKDNSVVLMLNGSVVGVDQKKTGVWNGSDQVYTYGNSSSDWGTSWTRTELNDSSFAVGISADLSGLSVLPTARVDHIQVQVFYEAWVLPIELLSFDAIWDDDNIAEVSWSTATESNNDYFEVLYSDNGKKWIEAAKISGAGNSKEVNEYNYKIELNPSKTHYFRLKQVDFNGESELFDIVTLDERKNEIRVWPNPSSDLIYVNGAAVQSVLLMDLEGQVVTRHTKQSENEPAQINVSDYEKGIYVLSISCNDGTFENRKIMVK